MFDISATTSDTDGGHWLVYVLRDSQGSIITYRVDTSVASGQSRTVMWVLEGGQASQYELDVYLYDSDTGRIEDTESSTVLPP